MSISRRLGTAIAAVWLMLGISPSSAAGVPMATAGRTTQPIGHYEFCKREPRECRQLSRSQDRLPLTSATMARLVKINNAVNAAVVPKTDLEIWGVDEVWSFPGRAGDCEDYVLAKRRMLIDAGVDPSNALITVVRQPNGEGHAVLTVRTTGGDFILDNLASRVMPWEQTVYTYLKRQSERNSGVWLTITGGRADAVASVK